MDDAHNDSDAIKHHCNVKTFGALGAGSEDKLAMFMDLVDGEFLHKIMTDIDPSPTYQRANKNVNNDVNLRIQNLNILIRRIKSYYQENLQQLIVMNLPNVLAISKDPLSAKSMEEMKRLLLLMLGCAVQCEQKEEFIEKIKSLEIETQAAIVTHIQEVTHNQENVLDMQWMDLAELPAPELDVLSRDMVSHLRKLIDERDDFAEVIVELTQERDYLQSQQISGGSRNSNPEHPAVPLSKEDRQHLTVELADSKARLRRSRQELEEKTEQLIDAKSEIERLDMEIQKLKQENTQLVVEARSARVYRDELDALRERAGRVDRLETELTRCKEKLHDVHFYKTRVEELREDNLTLLETKAMLEEQLVGARGRCDRLHELEKENLHLRSKLHDVEMDRDADKKRIEELVEENMALEISQKQSMNESAHLGWELEQLAKNSEASETRKSFVLELNESVSSRLLKLEKENQGLQSTIQELREASVSLEDGCLRAQELEKENQGLSKKLERLQTLLDEEKQATKDVEKLGDELRKDKQRLQKSLETVQADGDRQILELEQEKQHLSQAVASLRKRAQADSEARVREVEKENRILHQTISDTGGKLTRLEAEKRQAVKESEQLREQAERAEDLDMELARLERGRELLQKQVAALQITCDKAEALGQENAALEQDNRRLKKLADAARNSALRLEALEKDHQQLAEENLDLRRKLEALKAADVKLSQLQQENAELEREREQLSCDVNDLRALGKKAERLELSCQSLSLEKQRLQRSLDDSTAKAQGLERELSEAEGESQQLRRELEELRAAGRRLEGLEAERRRADQELAQMEKERKQLEKEARRLRQQLEVKEAALDESSLRLTSLEKENSALDRELNRLKETASRVKELEWENKELQKQATIDKRTLATLREDLVNEKLKVQQQWNELEALNQELEKIGLNREKLLQEEHSSEDSKYKILETKIESALKTTLEIREEKIQALESRLEESGSLNQQLRVELMTVKRNLEALKQRQEEEAHSQAADQAQEGPGLEKWSAEQREATAQLLRLKDRLIDIEKNNAALLTEKQLLKEQLRQLDSQNTQLNAQLLGLQRQSASQQEHSTALHTQMAQLQVEKSTLSSQGASLLAQNAALQGQVQTLEGELEALQRQREEVRTAHEGILLDHERLLTVHEHQAAEYEQLIGQHTALKTAQRGLEQEHRVLENKYAMLVSQKSAVEELETAVQKVRDKLEGEIEKNSLILTENQSLHRDIDRLLQAHEQLRKEYDGLQLQSKDLKTSLNNAQLDLNRWQARYDQLKEKHQHLDISHTKLGNHCELLTRLKGNLEEENHYLLSQIQMLSQQNQTLLERTMESKDMYHEEQKQYIDKLNSLRRQKEKLEEKIMDQYKFYDPTPKKRNQWVGAKALAKLIKPKKETGRERLRSAPDMPLPAPPPHDHSDGLPPLPPPPLPPRQSRRSLEGTAPHPGGDKSSRSPSLTPTHNNRAPLAAIQLCLPRTKVQEKVKPSRGCLTWNFLSALLRFWAPSSPRRPTSLGGQSCQGRGQHRTAGGSGDGGTGHEELLLRCTNSPTRNSTPGHTSSSSTRLVHRPRDEHVRLQSFDAVFVTGVQGNTDCWPNSTEISRNTSSSNSPINSRGSAERLHSQSGSLSSDDVAGLGPKVQGVHGDASLGRHSPLSSLSQSSTLPYDSSPQRSGSRPARRRPPSPGSEMVTLEEFLQETNTPPAPAVRSCSHEDLVTEYFIKAGERPGTGQPAPLNDGAKAPTSYVSPTVKASVSGEGRAPKPGQSVKPSIRQPENHISPNVRAGGGPQRSSNARASSGSLHRAFSLASADLLHASGPDSYQQEGDPPQSGGDPAQADVVRRAGTVSRERPLSARLAGPFSDSSEVGHHSLDARRLSYAPPKEQHSLSPRHHSSSASLSSGPALPERHSRGAARTHSRQTASHHRGEVAMVTPVRAVMAMQQEERDEPREIRRTESPLAKKQEGGGGISSTEEPPKNTPGSPDPSSDAQTVWYEYGCV
ncbi:protein Daple isoform X2 [Brienomyrus brachyistius]|uniref:protein Daple isoform X2 n=1 Tax=Brienomyrus brachyistius TaxID=42636 RepID=UPI0020B2BEA8|nr:protein Daple isoform X2 [Brienomyrus brachyistius]